jgi:hypothetical protein
LGGPPWANKLSAASNAELQSKFIAANLVATENLAAEKFGPILTIIIVAIIARSAKNFSPTHRCSHKNVRTCENIAGSCENTFLSCENTCSHKTFSVSRPLTALVKHGAG